jgi:hypothetical protein
VLALGLLLHPLEPRVVIGKLVQMGKRDLARQDGIVIGHVRQRVVGPWRRDCAGAGREHLSDEELARTAIGWSGGSVHRLLDVGWCERLLAELAQDVVGAAAELARERERGALVVGSFAHLSSTRASAARPARVRGFSPAGTP